VLDRPVFDNWNSADRVLITTNLFEPLEIIHDAAVIQAVLTLLNTQLDGWNVPEEGVPVAPMKLNFYQGDGFLGHLGVARAYWVAQVFGGFWSKETGETPRLVELLGLPEELVRW
jgi:hypothetical protein